MEVEVKVTCKPIGDNANKLRIFACHLAKTEYDANFNPLSETDFNSTLAELVQEAFEDGRRYQRNNP